MGGRGEPSALILPIEPAQVPAGDQEKRCRRLNPCPRGPCLSHSDRPVLLQPESTKDTCKNNGITVKERGGWPFPLQPQTVTLEPLPSNIWVSGSHLT